MLEREKQHLEALLCQNDCPQNTYQLLATFLKKFCLDHLNKLPVTQTIASQDLGTNLLAVIQLINTFVHLCHSPHHLIQTS